MASTYTFEGLQGAGFNYLLPIVPHNAKISSYSKSLRPELLGKIPGELRSDGWVGMADWVGHNTTAQDLKEWQEDGAGIGLRCHDVVAVDLDVTDPATTDMLISMAYMDLGFAPCRIGNAPKALLLFRLTDPGSLASKVTLPFLDGDTKHLIEILGARQQFVVQGVHPKTGKPYSWDESIEDLGLSGLPCVTVEALMAWLGTVSDFLAVLDFTVGSVSRSRIDDTPRDPDTLRGDVDVVRELVQGIPNTELDGYEELAAMAHAVWAACHPHHTDGLDILLEWAGRWPLEPDTAEAERIYNSIHDSTIGVQWLSDKATAAGVDTASMDFDMEGQGDTTGDTGEDPDSFWQRYVYVNQIKRFIDMRTGEWMDKEQFNDRLGKLGDNQTASSFFMEHRKPTMFCNLMDYQPGTRERVREDGFGGYQFNAWRPGPAHSDAWDHVERDPRALDLWLQLATHLFPEQGEREALLDWMAYLLQQPGQKPNWHPLIGGHIHGTGKDSLLIPLVEGLGDNARTIRTGDLEAQWTWWAENVQLVVVSEINSFERRAVMNRLKSYMASPPLTVEINKKGMPQYEVPNLFGLVMFTNNEDAVAIELSDRRFFVVWTHATPLSDAFYTEYHDLFTYSNTGSATVLDHLKSRDISGRDFKGRAPSTAAKETMRLAAMPVIEGQLVSAIENEEGCFGRDIVTMNEVELYLRGRAQGRPVSPQKLAIHLRAAGAHAIGRARLSSGERARLWVVRRAETYKGLPLNKVRDMYEEQVRKEGFADFDEGDSASL